MLSHKDGYVLKPILKPGEAGQREVIFYEEVASSGDSAAKELRKFIPKYFGTTDIKVGGQDLKWIVLGNATHGFAEPCIMDIKIGRQTWDPLATEEKRLSEAVSKKKFSDR